MGYLLQRTRHLRITTQKKHITVCNLCNHPISFLGFRCFSSRPCRCQDLGPRMLFPGWKVSIIEDRQAKHVTTWILGWKHISSPDQHFIRKHLQCGWIIQLEALILSKIYPNMHLTVPRTVFHTKHHLVSTIGTCKLHHHFLSPYRGTKKPRVFF